MFAKFTAEKFNVIKTTYRHNGTSVVETHRVCDTFETARITARELNSIYAPDQILTHTN